MGNYSGTTRCGHCGKSGHNKAGCPTLKERVERLKAEGHDDHWIVREHDRKAAARTARATGKRVCAYCKCHRKSFNSWQWERMDDSERAELGDFIETTFRDRWGDESSTWVEADTLYGTDGERGVGHSIRACKYRKADIADRTSEIKCARVSHLDRMISNGIGPGASVVFDEDTNVHRTHPTPGTFVITDVGWHLLGFERDEDALENMELLVATHVTQLFNPSPDYGMRLNVTLPNDCLELTKEENRYRSSYTDRVATLHRPASEAKVRAAIPFGWADATDVKTQAKIEEDLMNNVKTRAKK